MGAFCRDSVSGFSTRRFSLLLAAVFAGTSGAADAAETLKSPEPVTLLEAVQITAQRAAASEIEGPQSMETFGGQDVFDAGVYSLDEYFETLPEGEGGNETLVLIDGQPAYVDLASLPLEMIEGIELSRDGSMPQYGAYANGRVINIRLRKDYRGGETAGRVRGTFAGGGFERQGKASLAIKEGKWRVLVSVEHSRRNELRASQRAFSNNQDHTSLGGRDLRLAWGSPAVVQSATEEPLAGLTDASGAPVWTALVPEQQNGRGLSAADFQTGTNAFPATAAELRRFDTSAYRLLSAPSQRTSGNVAVHYSATPRLQVSLAATFTESRGRRTGPPPVSAASARTRVPAALNPFGQDVEVGLVHTEFGPTRQQTESRTGQVTARVSGKVGLKSSWNAAVAHRQTTGGQTAVDLDQAKLAAALAASDQSRRFNPFGDPALGPLNAHLYPELSIVRTREDRSRETRLDLGGNGHVVSLPAGDVRLNVRAEASERRQERVSTNATGSTPPVFERTSASGSGSGALTIPLLGGGAALPFVHRLETQVSGRYSRQEDDGAGRHWQQGAVWSPHRSLLFRARHSETTTEPPRTVVPGSDVLLADTLLDPARGGMPVANVEVFTRDFVNAVPSRGVRDSVGATWEPAFVRGVRLSVSYDVSRRENLLERDFAAQDIVNNETAFPGRVLRAPAEAADAALGYPGRILAVDLTPGNTGARKQRDVEMTAEYRVPPASFGRIRFYAMAERVLESTYEVLPGVPFVHEDAGDTNPPAWRMRGGLTWNHAGATAALRVRHTGRAELNGSGASPIPARSVAGYTQWDLNVGYRLNRDFWGTHGRGFRVVAGIENLFGQPPPFADTLSGYRNGSPAGRGYSLALTMPW